MFFNLYLLVSPVLWLSSLLYISCFIFSAKRIILSSDFATLQDLISNGVGLFLVNASMSHLQHAWWANGTLRLQSTGLHGSSIIWLYNLTRSYAIVRCGIFVWTVFLVRLPCTASRWWFHNVAPWVLGFFFGKGPPSSWCFHGVMFSLHLSTNCRLYCDQPSYISFIIHVCDSVIFVSIFNELSSGTIGIFCD